MLLKGLLHRQFEGNGDGEGIVAGLVFLVELLPFRVKNCHVWLAYDVELVNPVFGESGCELLFECLQR